MKQFTGFSGETFSVYTPEKWSSMVHNLPRMRNKDLLVALCELAAEPLAPLLDGMARAASDEIPNIVNQKKVEAQWVYWFRDAAARANLTTFLGKTPLDQAVIFNIAPQDKHVTLAVVIRFGELWVGLRVAPGATVDRRNLKQKLAQSWERERFGELLQGLPEGAVAGFEGALQPTSEVTSESLLATAEGLESQNASYCIGTSLSVEQVVSLQGELVDHVRNWLQALVPVYRFVAWTRDNDLIEASKQIQEEKAQKRRQATSFSVGDRVRFITGLFVGKIGVVQETDTKAQVKVMVGKMSVVVAGSDLTAAK